LWIWVVVVVVVFCKEAQTGYYSFIVLRDALATVKIWLCKRLHAKLISSGADLKGFPKRVWLVDGIPYPAMFLTGVFSLMYDKNYKPNLPTVKLTGIVTT